VIRRLASHTRRRPAHQPRTPFDAPHTMVAPTLISVDVSKPAWEQDPEKPLHNRWHPDIPAVASVKEGEVFKVECIDWTGGQIKNDDSADDVKGVDLSQVAPRVPDA